MAPPAMMNQIWDYDLHFSDIHLFSGSSTGRVLSASAVASLAEPGFTGGQLCFLWLLELAISLASTHSDGYQLYRRSGYW